MSKFFIIFFFLFSLTSFTVPSRVKLKQQLNDLSDQIQLKRATIPEVQKIKELQKEIQYIKNKTKAEYQPRLTALDQQIAQQTVLIQIPMSNYMQQLIALSKNPEKNKNDIEAIQQKWEELKKTTTLGNLMEEKEAIEQKIQETLEEQAEEKENEIKELAVKIIREKKLKNATSTLDKKFQNSYIKLQKLEKL